MTATTETSTVVVRAPFQVAHDGTVYPSGSTCTVPTEVAEHWVVNGWVDPVAVRRSTATKASTTTAKARSSSRR